MLFRFHIVLSRINLSSFVFKKKKGKRKASCDFHSAALSLQSLALRLVSWSLEGQGRRQCGSPRPSTSCQSRDSETPLPPQRDQGRHWLDGDVWWLDGPGTVPTFQSRTPASTQSDLTLRQFSVKGNFVVARFFGLI